MKIIDISQELFSCTVFPGDLAPSFERVKQVAQDGYNLTNLTLCAHNGTHTDAPCHFIPGGKTIDELDIGVFYGACTIAAFEGDISAEDIIPVLERCGERLLLKGECQLTEESALLLTKSRVKLIGIENQSVDKDTGPKIIHHILLGAGLIPLEGLNLSGAQPGDYILSAFPINLAGSDGSPTRAVLIQE
jgi:arylformamidase